MTYSLQHFFLPLDTTDDRFRISMVYVATLLGPIVLLVAGMMMSMIGPAAGRLLGIPGFLTTGVIFITLVARLRNGNAEPVRNLHACADSFRRFLFVTMAGFLAVSITASVVWYVASDGAGSADHMRPILEHQGRYQLSDKGRLTDVTRERYVLVGSSAVIAWYSGLIVFPLFCLHMVMFGRPPFGSDAHAPGDLPQTRPIP